eukprot:776700-Rhodomonas_salina.2
MAASLLRFVRYCVWRMATRCAVLTWRMATRCAVLTRRMTAGAPTLLVDDHSASARPPILLRPCYALSGTDVAPHPTCTCLPATD